MFTHFLTEIFKGKNYVKLDSETGRAAHYVSFVI